MRELRAGHDQHAADLRVLSHNASEYQADLQARDHETFEMKELIFRMGVDMEEIRKELEKAQEVPGRETPDISEHQEQMGALRHDLARVLQQTEVLERKVREGEQRLSQLQKEVRDCHHKAQAGRAPGHL